MTGRHRAVLELLADHAGLDTGQVAALLFDSRPTAARHMNMLLRAGLVYRYVETTDRTHRAHYEVSPAGSAALGGCPAGASTRDPDQALVNEFVVGLTAWSRTGGPGQLYRWWPGPDAVHWLRHHGVPVVCPHGRGIWIHNALTVHFLFHVDHDQPDLVRGEPPPPPTVPLAGYRRAATGIPVDTVLVLTRDVDRERQLHAELAERPLPVPVAVTTRARLRTAGNPAEPIWTVGGDSSPVRLIDVPRR